MQGSAAAPVLPNPVLYFLGQEYVTINGKQITRYHFDVLNKDHIRMTCLPRRLIFRLAAPTRRRRARGSTLRSEWQAIEWLLRARQVGGPEWIWFALETDVIPPSWIYIEINDRKTNTKYKSNLADTTL